MKMAHQCLLAAYMACRWGVYFAEKVCFRGKRMRRKLRFYGWLQGYDAAGLNCSIVSL
jgi:hypothetical protein